MEDWITQTIDATGSLGIALLMLLENVFPPIPSEVVLPLAGFHAGQGRLSFALALLGATIGSLAGLTIWYAAARWLGADGMKRFARRHGRLLTLTPDDIDGVNEWFGRHGGKAILIGRLIPGIRTLISIPAGVSGMPLGKFLALSAIGTALWSALLIYLGYWLDDRFDRVGTWISPVSNVVLVLAAGYYLYRVATFRRRVDRPAEQA